MRTFRPIILCFSMLPACSSMAVGSMGDPSPTDVPFLSDTGSQDAAIPDNDVLEADTSENMIDTSDEELLPDAGEDVTPDLSADIALETVSLDPDDVSIAPTPVLEIQSMTFPTSVVFGGLNNSVWFRARAHFGRVTLRRVRIVIDGSWVSVEAISVLSRAAGSSGPLVDHVIPPTALSPVRPGDGAADVTLRVPLRFPVEEWVEFGISYTLRPVVSSVDAPVDGSDYPRSGAVLRFGLQAGEIGPAWGTMYATRLNLDAQSDAGEPVYVEGLPMFSEPHCVRRNAPTIVSIPLMGADAALQNGTRTLLEYEMRNYPGPALTAWKRVTFFTNLVEKLPPKRSEGLMMGNFRFLRNGTPVDSTQIRIVDGAGRDLTGAYLPMRVADPREIVVSWRGDREEVLTVPVRYALTAVVTGALPGQIFLTRIQRDMYSDFSSGVLTADGLMLPPPRSTLGGPLVGPHLRESTGTEQFSYFVWRDLVEPAGSLTAWTNGYGAYNLTASQELGR